MRTSEIKPTYCEAAFAAAPSPLLPIDRGEEVTPAVATASCALEAR